MIANYIDEIIMFLVGAWATATGFGFLPLPMKDPLGQQQWQARFGTMLRWIGPILLVISVVLAMSKSAGAGGGG
jgi:hypothetical protein